VLTVEALLDFVDAQERIKELSQLIALLPIANYSLLRALTAHLILIVQNAAANKMTMRNVGIVFSPTLGIPAGVFSLMLGEFNRVFNVDPDLYVPGEADASQTGGPNRRNSRQYSDTAADQLLGLSGRTLPGVFLDPTMLKFIPDRARSTFGRSPIRRRRLLGSRRKRNGDHGGGRHVRVVRPIQPWRWADYRDWRLVEGTEIESIERGSHSGAQRQYQR
jgi:hypothetical protein